MTVIYTSLINIVEHLKLQLNCTCVNYKNLDQCFQKLNAFHLKPTCLFPFFGEVKYLCFISAHKGTLGQCWTGHRAINSTQTVNGRFKYCLKSFINRQHYLTGIYWYFVLLFRCNQFESSAPVSVSKCQSNNVFSQL